MEQNNTHGAINLNTGGIDGSTDRQTDGMRRRVRTYCMESGKCLAICGRVAIVEHPEICCQFLSGNRLELKTLSLWGLLQFEHLVYRKPISYTSLHLNFREVRIN